LQRSSAFVGKLALENESRPSSSGPVKSPSVRDGRPMGLARWVHSTVHTRDAPLNSVEPRLFARATARVGTPRLSQILRFLEG